MNNACVGSGIQLLVLENSIARDSFAFAIMLSCNNLGSLGEAYMVIGKKLCS